MIWYGCFILTKFNFSFCKQFVHCFICKPPAFCGNCTRLSGNRVNERSMRTSFGFIRCCHRNCTINIAFIVNKRVCQLTTSKNSLILFYEFLVFISNFCIYTTVFLNQRLDFFDHCLCIFFLFQERNTCENGKIFAINDDRFVLICYTCNNAFRIPFIPNYRSKLILLPKNFVT